MQVSLAEYHHPYQILHQVRDKVKWAAGAGETIDYLSFVPDGEPTLDVNLGQEIDLLRPLGIKIAIITNSSLIYRADVRQTLMKADWVSLKVDSTLEPVWRKVNRPHGALRLDSILCGALEFAQVFKGELVTETMLVAGVNDGAEQLEDLTEFLAQLEPDAAFLSIPTRPPAEEWVHPPDEGTINRAYQILEEKVGRVEYLIGYEGNAFAFTGNVEDDLLSITAVHPMREDAVSEFLARAETDWDVVHGMVERDLLIETSYDGQRFYLRKIH
jgi:wyosine [tRNA(Phe)-imidazoG37] synthetase (radical SAM superfamily)